MNDMVARHLNQVHQMWCKYATKLGKDINNHFDLTNLKLNFINLILKSTFGGDKAELFQLIGDRDFENIKHLNIEIGIYEIDNEIALITNLCWLGGVNSKIPCLGINRETGEKIDILTYFMILTDLVDLKIGYVSYKENDKEYNKFKKFGFKETNLKTDKDCFIMIKKPRKIACINQNS